MRHEWLMAEVSGQGILFLGYIVAQAAMHQGLYTTFMPTDGVAMRGSKANCIVRISDEPIGSPLLEEPYATISLNQQSFNKFQPLIIRGGMIVTNSSSIKTESFNRAQDLRITWVPATELALEVIDKEQAANMVALGAFLASDSTITIDTHHHVCVKERNPKKQKVVEMNKKVVHAGMQFVLDLSAT